MMNEPNLSLDHLLKLSLCYLPHMLKDDLMKKLLMEVSDLDPDNRAFADKIELVGRVQETLLETCREYPIFNYQFSSFAVLSTSMKGYLATALHRVLMHFRPESPSVFSFYTSVLSKEAPPLYVFEVGADSANIAGISRALWRYSTSYSKEELVPIVTRSIKAIVEAESVDMESLYYLTSIMAPPTGLVKKELLKPCSYYLPVCYNLGITPDPLSGPMKESVNVKLLYGEPLVKALILLNRLGEFDLFSKATENLSYSPATAPAISKPLLDELVTSLTKTLASKVNYYAASTFILQNISQFSRAEVSPVFSYFKDKWDQINPQLQERLGKLVEFNSITETLIIKESHEARKRLIALKATSEVSSTNTEVLEAMVKHKVLIPSLVSKYLNLTNKIKHEKELLRIISLVLELLSIVGNYRAFLEVIYAQIERYKLWPALSQEDYINFFFVLSETSEGAIKVPAHIEENFKKNISLSNNYEELNTSLENGLKYYKSFKYNTEFEQRLVISNNIELRETSPELTVSPEMPIDQLTRYVKMHAIYNRYKIASTDGCKIALEKYYHHRRNDITINKFKEEITDVIYELIQGKTYSLVHSENMIEENTKWKADFFFSIPKVWMLLYSEQDVYYNESGEEAGLCLINHIIKKQIENASKGTVMAITHTAWREMTPEKQKSVMGIINKNIR